MTKNSVNKYMPEGSLLSTKENKDFISSVSGLEKAMESGEILEANAILCDENVNLHIDLMGIRGIIPKDECVYSGYGTPTKDIAIITRVGKPVCFKVKEMKFDEKGVYFILSRKDAQKECFENYIEVLQNGDIIKAKATHFENFGAFMDIGCGISSLLSIDSISVSRISHPKDRLSLGEQVYCVVKGRDNFGRIFLSMRELFGTWEENASCFTPGSTVAGIIRSVENYGVFVELTPNLAGLAEIKDKLPNEIIDGKAEICCKAAVYIKSIIKEKMKVKLVLIDYENTKAQKEPIKYFIDTDKVKHIDRWVYSPSVCDKIIESDFTVS